MLSLADGTLHTGSHFFEEGGDSLSALLTVRGAMQQLRVRGSSGSSMDERTGEMRGVFSPAHLIANPRLHAYAAFLEANGVHDPATHIAHCEPESEQGTQCHGAPGARATELLEVVGSKDQEEDESTVALACAAGLGCAVVVGALLAAGVRADATSVDATSTAGHSMRGSGARKRKRARKGVFATWM